MDNLLISHMTLRKVLGFLGLLFPVVLVLTGLFFSPVILTSLSAYYWSNAGVLFSSFLVTFGVFLLTYTGYDKTDNLITTISGVSMIGVALFPVIGGSAYLFSFLSPELNNILHFIFAVVAFASLGVMSYFQFIKSAGEMTPSKKKRNLVYRVCGIIIFASIIALLPVKVFSLLESIRLFLLLEALIVVAFGFSWLVKGEGLLSDKA